MVSGNKPINKPVRGVRDSIPPGYVLGRTGSGSGPPILLPAGQFTTKGYVANTTIQVGGAAGGDLSGTYPNPTVAKIQGNPVSSTAPSNGQVLEWNGSNWVPTNISSGAPASVQDNGTLYFAVSDSSGQLVLDGSGDPIFIKEVLPATSIPPLKGVTDGSNAAAGIVGEYVVDDIPLGSFVPVTSAATVYNVGSISLTAGDWDVSGTISALSVGSCTFLFAGASSVSATMPATELCALFSVSGGGGAGNGQSLAIPTQRFSLTSTTTIYLCGRLGDSDVSGTSGLYGLIHARRVR